MPVIRNDCFGFLWNLQKSVCLSSSYSNLKLVALSVGVACFVRLLWFLLQALFPDLRFKSKRALIFFFSIFFCCLPWNLWVRVVYLVSQLVVIVLSGLNLRCALDVALSAITTRYRCRRHSHGKAGSRQSYMFFLIYGFFFTTFLFLVHQFLEEIRSLCLCYFGYWLDAFYKPRGCREFVLV